MARRERRQKPRSDTNLLVSLRLEQDSGWSGFARTLDVSETGALLESPDHFEKGQVLLMEFLLDEDRVARLRATVSRVTSVKGVQQVGVTFEKLSPETRRLLARQLKS